LSLGELEREGKEGDVKSGGGKAKKEREREG